MKKLVGGVGLQGGQDVAAISQTSSGARRANTSLSSVPAQNMGAESRRPIVLAVVFLGEGSKCSLPLRRSPVVTQQGQDP